jgi:hypothetical protein
MTLNSRNRRLYLLAAAFLVASCTVGERHRETITRDWPATEIRRIELNEVNGSVSIEATPSDKISLVADIRSRNFRPQPNAENHGYFEARIDGDTLTIGQRKHARVHFPLFFRSNQTEIDYRLQVPATIALDVRTVNGHITTRGVNGETDLTTVNGPIEIETPGASEVSLHTVNGRLRAKFLQTFQGARMKTVNGSVEASLPPTASFACDFSQVNGDFEASFPLSIHSHPGSRRVSGEVNGGRYELRIVTVNGDIRISHDGQVMVPNTPAAPNTLPPPPAPPAVPRVPAVPST